MVVGGGDLVAKSCLTLVTPWTVAHQAPLSREFPRQEYWSGLPFPSPGGLPHPGIAPKLAALQADSSPTEPSGKPAQRLICCKHSVLVIASFTNSDRQHTLFILARDLVPGPHAATLLAAGLRTSHKPSAPQSSHL